MRRPLRCGARSSCRSSRGRSPSPQGSRSPSSLGEFGATVFVVRADWPTVPVAIFRFLGRPGESNVGAAMALCVVLMAIVAAAALVSERALVRRRTP